MDTGNERCGAKPRGQEDLSAARWVQVFAATWQGVWGVIIVHM